MPRPRADGAAMEAARQDGRAAYESGASVLTCPHLVKPRRALRLRQAWCAGWFDAAEARAVRIRQLAAASGGAAANRSDW